MGRDVGIARDKRSDCKAAGGCHNLACSSTRTDAGFFPRAKAALHKKDRFRAPTRGRTGTRQQEILDDVSADRLPQR
jgi:hypothetical protein